MKKTFSKFKHKEAISLLEKGRKILPLTKDQRIDNLTAVNKGLAELLQEYVTSCQILNREYTLALQEMDRCGCHNEFLDSKFEYKKETEN